MAWASRLPPGAARGQGRPHLPVAPWWPLVVRSSSRPTGVPAHWLSVPLPGSPGTAPSHAGARRPRRPRSPARPRLPRPSPGLLVFKLVPSITPNLTIARHQLLQVPHHFFSQLLGRNRPSRERRGRAEIGINARMPLEALNPEVFKGEGCDLV